MKDIEFLGNSLQSIREFPPIAKRSAGHQLDRLQHGLDPIDWKPMKSVAPGVREIRIHHQGQYRVIYLIPKGETVYVLHAFQKKTQKTNKQEIKAAQQALKEI